jgi:regulator of replication initiation timing
MTTHEAPMAAPPTDPSMLTAISGWVVALIGMIGTMLKLAHDRAVARDKAKEERRREQLEHTQEIELGALGESKAARLEVEAELRRQVATHEDRIARLEGQIQTMIDANAQLLDVNTQLRVTNARLETELAAALKEGAAERKENARLRASRDHYRALALEGAEAARKAGSIHVQTLHDEISEADEASSKAGSP